MGLFKPASPTMAYLKCSIQGFGGSGKTMTGVQMAIGLHKYLRLDSPVFFLDTENGSHFMKKYFDRASIPLETHATMAFAELLQAVDESEQNGKILLIDSITHFWQELMEAFKKKKNRTTLRINDQQVLKAEWAQFTKKYNKSNLHIFMLGRAANDFQEHTDAEGIKELTRLGTKISCETNLGFEPSLSLEMTRERVIVGSSGSPFKHKISVLKDRENAINGASTDFYPTPDDKIDLTENNPAFQFILPHIKGLNLNGPHIPISDANSISMFNTDYSAEERARRRDIALEELEDQLKLTFPGSDAESRKAKIEALQSLLGTSSWTAIQGLSVEKLISAKESLKTLKKEVA